MTVILIVLLKMVDSYGYADMMGNYGNHLQIEV